MGGVGFKIGDAEGRQAGRRGLGLPHGLQGREFHFLVIGERITALVAEHDDGQGGGQAEGGRHGEGSLGDPGPFAAQQHDRRDAEHEHRRSRVAGRNGVDKLGLGDRIEQHLAEAGDLHAHGVWIESRADWVLHPAVGDQDP